MAPLPQIEVGAVSIPVDQELHCTKAFPIAAMRENAGNDILIAANIAKRGDTVRWAKKWNHAIGVEDVLSP